MVLSSLADALDCALSVTRWAVLGKLPNSHRMSTCPHVGFKDGLDVYQSKEMSITTPSTLSPDQTITKHFIKVLYSLTLPSLNHSPVTASKKEFQLSKLFKCFVILVLDFVFLNQAKLDSWEIIGGAALKKKILVTSRNANETTAPSQQMGSWFPCYPCVKSTTTKAAYKVKI